MATGFAAWVEQNMEAKGWKGPALAAKLTEAYMENNRVTITWDRGKVHDLLHGSPKIPPPDLLHKLCEVFEKPTTEALDAIGYEIPRQNDVTLHPILASVLATTSWAAQERLAGLIPGLLDLVSLGAGVSREVESSLTTRRDEDAGRGQPIQDDGGLKSVDSGQADNKPFGSRFAEMLSEPVERPPKRRGSGPVGGRS